MGGYDIGGSGKGSEDMMLMSTPTNAEVMETFRLWSEKVYLGCSRHGGGRYLLAFSVGVRCKTCRREMGIVPDGTVMVWGHKEIEVVV